MFADTGIVVRNLRLRIRYYVSKRQFINSLTFSVMANNIRANVTCNLSKFLFNLGIAQMGIRGAKNQSRASGTQPERRGWPW